MSQVTPCKSETQVYKLIQFKFNDTLMLLLAAILCKDHRDIRYSTRNSVCIEDDVKQYNYN